MEGCEGSSGGVERRRTSLFERLVKTAAAGRGGVSLAPHTVNRNTAFFPGGSSHNLSAVRQTARTIFQFLTDSYITTSEM